MQRLEATLPKDDGVENCTLQRYGRSYGDLQMTKAFPNETEASITATALDSLAPTLEDASNALAARPDEAPAYNERDLLEFLVELVTETGDAAKAENAGSSTYDAIFDEATRS